MRNEEYLQDDFEGVLSTPKGFFGRSRARSIPLGAYAEGDKVERVVYVVHFLCKAIVRFSPFSWERVSRNDRSRVFA